MPDLRWQRIEQLYHEASAFPEPARSAWLMEACGNDEALRSEVEELLRYDSAATEFLEESALTAAAAGMVREGYRRIEGRRLGGYEVQSFLGEGGMGEVYRARDMRLERDVALKVFENMVSPEAVKRFEAEARMASVLNHPNIVTIYGVGEDSDIAYIAMELVHGRTLRALLSEGVRPLEEALDVIIQLADGIAAAHSAGIIHRDLKPENVMITPEGRVKILDFGIAKVQRELTTWSRNGGVLKDPTATEHGRLLGTVGYMSPEQAQGRSAGPASDQFSFGVICLEMLTGERPFARSNRNETLQAIMTAPAAAPTLDGKAAPLSAVLHRCLQKDPADRFPDSATLAAELRRIKEAWHRSDQRDGLTRRHALSLMTVVIAAAATGIAAWRFLPAAPPAALAVLPFRNPARDEAADYLCDGITESLIRQLWMLPEVRVSAYQTVVRFRGSPVDPLRVSKELDVGSLLIGEVTRRGNRVLISAELIDAQGVRLWGKTFDRMSGDVLAVQNEIAIAILTEGLGLTLSEAQHRQLSGALTGDARAYELFLQAIHHIRLDTEEGFLAARALLMQTVERDPNFALALVTLASTYSAMTINGYAPASASWAPADVYVRRAMEIAPNLPEVPAELASQAFFGRRDRAASERHWRVALESPHGGLQTELLVTYSLQKWASGDPHRALAIATTARQSDPLSAQAAVREADLLACLGRLDEASTIYQRLTQVLPDDLRALFGLAEVRRKQGRFDEAIALRRQAHAKAGDNSLDDVFATLRGAAGYDHLVRLTAERDLERLMDRAVAGDYVSELDLARSYAQLARLDETFTHLASAIEEGSPGLMFLLVDPAWDNVRADPRFAAAVQRLGLEGS